MSARDTPRLGKGLAALLGDAAMPTGRMPRNIPVADLDAGPFQPRHPIEPSELADLIDSVRSRGILQPILVRRDPVRHTRFQIVAGERRWRAAQAAGLAEIPALMCELSDADAMAAALVENLQRLDLNAIEEAEGYRRLATEFGLTQEALAGAVGRSRSHVANSLRLLNLPSAVQAEVRRGALTAGHARALLAHPEPAKTALVVIARGLNVRQTEALATRGAPRRLPRTDADTAAVEAQIAEKLGLRVKLRTSGQRGSLQIQFETLDQLDGVITLLTRD